ncbi:MAG: hydroxymethylbilane synthase [Rhizobiales bacterium]|nr:hydroxymethylbilane synthase [Hyphomicrobiales bacterium]
MAQSFRPLLRIGSRGSPLALAQSEEAKRRLVEAHGLAPDAITITAIRTTGDRIQDRPLSEAGGKGLFTKELEQALLDGEIDLAVHSAKDMPTWLPDGLVLAGYLPREDVRDVIISRHGGGFDALPQRAVIGSASLRRQALALRCRPDATVISFRGNIDTRLRKLADGEADATLLALAGLKRLGKTEVATAILPVDTFLPAVGQGAITIETRENDTATRALVDAIAHRDTETALTTELIVRPDGSELHETTREGAIADAARLGDDAGRELKRAAAPGFFDHG